MQNVTLNTPRFLGVWLTLKAPQGVNYSDYALSREGLTKKTQTPKLIKIRFNDIFNN